MMKALIVVGLLMSTACAQQMSCHDEETTKDLAKVVIPDFKVTAESLAKAQKKEPLTRKYDFSGQATVLADGKAGPVCYTVRSYKFDNDQTPKLVNETQCTVASKNSFQRAR